MCGITSGVDELMSIYGISAPTSGDHRESCEGSRESSGLRKGVRATYITDILGALPTHVGQLRPNKFYDKHIL